jgi:hypothetical protein
MRSEIIRPYLERLIGQWLEELVAPADEQGCYHVRVNTSGFIVEIVDFEPTLVRMWSPVVIRIPRSVELLEMLNGLNANGLGRRIFLTDDQVILATELVAETLDARELGYRPEEPGEFSGDSRRDNRSAVLAGGEAPEPAAEAESGGPGAGQNVAPPCNRPANAPEARAGGPADGPRRRRYLPCGTTEQPRTARARPRRSRHERHQAQPISRPERASLEARPAPFVHVAPSARRWWMTHASSRDGSRPFHYNWTGRLRPSRQKNRRIPHVFLPRSPEPGRTNVPLALVPIGLPALPLLRLWLRLTFSSTLAAHDLPENAPGLPYDGLWPLHLVVPRLAVVLQYGLRELIVVRRSVAGRCGSRHAPTIPPVDPSPHLTRRCRTGSTALVDRIGLAHNGP